MGREREGVEVPRGDPDVVTAVSDPPEFEHRHRSVARANRRTVADVAPKTTQRRREPVALKSDSKDRVDFSIRSVYLTGSSHR